MRTRRREAEGRKEGREGSGGGGRRGRGVVLWRSVWFGLVWSRWNFILCFFLFFLFWVFWSGFCLPRSTTNSPGGCGVYGVCCTKIWRGFSRRGALCQRTRLYYFPGVFSGLFSWSGSTVLNTLRLKFNNWVPIKLIHDSYDI